MVQVFQRLSQGLLNEKGAILDMLDVHVLYRVLSTFCDAIDARDSYTGGHQRGVSAVSRRIAQVMKLSDLEVDLIRFGGLIHDVGKLAIPTQTLTKTTALYDEEVALIKTHSLRGVSILQGLELPNTVTSIVLAHHERLDGSGYPQGLCGGDISIGAQIVAVADSFDAMVKPRPYRSAFPLDRVIGELKAAAGLKLNEAAVDILEGLINERDEDLLGQYGSCLNPA